MDEQEGTSENTKRIWMPWGDMLPGVPNDVVLQHILPRLNSSERAIASLVNRGFAEANRRLELDEEFANFIASRRSLCGLQRVPSLMVFQLAPRHQHVYQCYFRDAASAAGKPRPLCPRRRLPRRYIAYSAMEYAWQGVGSAVITTGCDPEAGGYAGRWDRRDGSWRWDRTPPVPPPAGPRARLEYLDARRVMGHDNNAVTRFAVLGRRGVKLDLSGAGEYDLLLAQGSVYDADADAWSHLRPLYKPDHPFILRDCHVFQWRGLLFVAARHLLTNCYYVCNCDAERGVWSAWNSTPEQVHVAEALSSLYATLWAAPFCPTMARVRPSAARRGVAAAPAVDFVAATDGTLFAVRTIVGDDDRRRFEVYFLRAARGVNEWARVRIPPLEAAHRYGNSMAWPLEAYGGIVVVSDIAGRPQDFAWWFVSKGGVYARGMFTGIFPQIFSRSTRCALIHTHV